MKNIPSKPFYRATRQIAIYTVGGLVSLVATVASAQQSLLNVSYDVTREFYKEYNVAFAKYWKGKSGQEITINQSHGGSSRQAGAVIGGLEADVITMNQATDIDILHERGNLVPANWATRFPNGSAPNTSVTVFIVRKGNPKGIKDWDDLVKPGVGVIISNPKTSGNGRYSYLGAWGYALKKTGKEAEAKAFATKFVANIPVLDTGGRAATTTFAQRGIGDALLTFENEAILSLKELGEANVELVYPSTTILAENVVSVVDKVVDKKGTRKAAEAYLEYLYSDEGQELAAKHFFRPRSEKIAAKYPAVSKKVNAFTVTDVFGGWKKAQKDHFDDGGTFDQIILAVGKK